MSNLLFIAFVLLAAVNAWADEKPEPACRREGDRVSCSAEGFKVLTDALIEYRAAEEKWSLRHTACVTTREAAETGLSSCEAARKVAEDRLEASKPNYLRPVLAVSLAVLSAAALTTAIAVDAPSNVRLGLGAGGLAGIAAGFVFVLPERIP